MYAHLGVLAALACAAAGLESNKYLIVSEPHHGKVVYFRIGSPAGGKLDKTIHPLIDSGLKSPQGLAVDQNPGRQSRLFVCDPESRKILSYKLQFNNGVLLTTNVPSIAAQNVESRWVAVDGVGTIYFTDETNNMILKVSGDQVLRGNPTPAVVYSGLEVPQLDAPGGVAVDNFNLFWSNKASGTTIGAVIRGFENPPETNILSSVKPIAKNAQKIYGLCLSQNNVYFTDERFRLFGVKKMGGAIATVSEQLDQPRGCVWDNDGTVFVADKKGNAVYSFPGNMHTLGHARMTKVVDIDDAFGLAVISGSQQAHYATTSLVMFLSCILACW